MSGRISTFSHTQNLLTQSIRLQSNMASLQVQSSSGLKSQDYKGIATDSQRLLNLESQYKRTGIYNTNSNTAVSRIELMYDNIGSIISSVTSIISEVNATLSGSSTDALQNSATNTSAQIASLLNAKIGDRYLFSGSAVDTAPIDLSNPAYTAQTSPSTTNTSYYQGNSDLAKVEVSNNYVVSYGVTADNSAFEKIFRALNLISNNTGDETALNEAYDLLNQASDELATVQAGLSQDANNINAQVDANTTLLDLLEKNVSDIKNADLAEVAVLITNYETQLSTAYSMMTKLLNLNLSDYVK